MPLDQQRLAKHRAMEKIRRLINYTAENTSLGCNFVHKNIENMLWENNIYIIHGMYPLSIIK